MRTRTSIGRYATETVVHSLRDIKHRCAACATESLRSGVSQLRSLEQHLVDGDRRRLAYETLYHVIGERRVR